MEVKKTLGNIESSAIVCVVLAILTFLVPWLVGILWIAAAFAAQKGTLTQFKRHMYVQLKDQKQDKLALKALEPTISEQVNDS